MLWTAQQYQFRFPRPALVMGIVNVTPDSFSDGGRFLDTESAIEHGLALVLEGADLLDVGGESTRPGAGTVTSEEECRRVIPVIQGLAQRVAVPISVDTSKPEVAEAALAAGASIINDVGATWGDSRMPALAAESGAGYLAMHMQGRPQTMQEHPEYADVTTEVLRTLGEVVTRCRQAGLRPEQLALDPGIGFGKTVQHNLELLGRMGLFRELERPVAIGVSRKSFLGKLLGDVPVGDRLAGGLAAACLAVAQGVAIVRTHDVRDTVRALRVAEAILGAQRA